MTRTFDFIVPAEGGDIPATAELVPGEVRNARFDFRDRLDTAETLTTIGIVATRLYATDDIDIDGEAVSGTVATCSLASDAAIGSLYQVAVTVTTSDGQRLKTRLKVALL